jgi:hypothetical protein
LDPSRAQPGEQTLARLVYPTSDGHSSRTDVPTRSTEKSECVRMDEPITPEKTLSPFISRRLGWALRERITLYPTLPSRLYDLVMRLDCSERPPQRPDGEVS